jgi:hypothetical protein
MIFPYSHIIEERMQTFYESLSEKDKRRYAAIETLKLSHGGQTYISELLGCDPKTIKQGLLDLEDDEEIKKNE